MKTEIKIALLSLLCVMAHGGDVNTTKNLSDNNDEPNQVILGKKIEVLDEQEEELIEDFIKVSQERHMIEQASLKRIKSLAAIEDNYQKSKKMVKHMKEVAEDPEPFIKKRQVELLADEIKNYKSLNMVDKVEMLQTMKKNIQQEIGEK